MNQIEQIISCLQEILNTRQNVFLVCINAVNRGLKISTGRPAAAARLCKTLHNDNATMHVQQV